MSNFFTKQGRIWVEAFPYKGLNVSVLILGGVRYALGRASYAPSSVMGFCKANWQDLEPNTRHTIMRDVLDWLGDRHEYVKPDQVDMAYPDEWRAFLRWCHQQDRAEAKKSAEAVLYRRDSMQGVDEFFEVLK